MDTYTASVNARSPVYPVSGLSKGVPTLMIVMTSTRDAASVGDWVWVYAFDVIG